MGNPDQVASQPGNEQRSRVLGKRRIRIYRWRGRTSEHGNFGDEITAPIVERLFGMEVVPSPMRAAELLGAGSILDSWSRARARTRLAHHLTLARPRDLHVWGTGLMLPREPKWPQRLHVHAVRGELTAQKAGVNTVLGDPGILASLLVEKPKDKQLSVGFVPHYVDFDLGRSLQVPSDWKVINPEWPVDEVLSSIAGSELIVSSSLHGLITADSFGIPCVWLGTSNPLHGASDFKFRDYETSRRASLNEPLTYDQIVKMDATQISTIATRPDRSIETWQKELIEAFPFR